MHVHHHADGDLHGMPAGRFLGVALAATLCLVIAEFAGGHFGHSIALTSDALHNLYDIPTMLISWFALRWAARPADHERTYGYQRAGASRCTSCPTSVPCRLLASAATARCARRAIPARTAAR